MAADYRKSGAKRNFDLASGSKWLGGALSGRTIMKEIPRMSHLIPRRQTPELSLPRIGADPFTLSQSTPERMTMLVFYRGIHCPICKQWLGDLESKMPDFRERGVDVLAASMDSAERAEKAYAGWGIADVPLGYDMTEDQARSFGLYISSKREGSDEPDRFSEPGLFLIRPDRTLYAASIQSMPFTRPDFGDLVGALDFIHDKDYPPRGDLG